MKLGERLRAIAEMVPPGSRLADIGTDHAYLPLYLVKANQIQMAIAVDVNPGPFASAYDAVARAGMSKLIDVRLGDGLRVVTPGEADVVVMAGMGGITMIQIMEEGLSVLAHLKRLVLQPMVAVAQVRRWLQSHGWRIVEETIVEDEGRLYELIAAEPGQMEASELLEVGPVIWANRHPLLTKLLQQRIDTLHYIVRQMEKSATGHTDPKYIELKATISQLEARLVCLQPVKQ